MKTLHSKERRAGFTLVEILVAITLLTVIMTGVMMAFSSSLRAMKTGYQAMDAVEQARAALDTMQRDLESAFANRRHGDLYSFFGTPIGFTFVGVLDGDSPLVGDQPNLARVTYVVYVGDAVRLAQGKIPAAAEQARLDKALFSDPDGELVITYPLLRLIEPGQTGLDTFDVPWIDLYKGTQSNPEFPTPAEATQNFRRAFDDALDGSGFQFEQVITKGIGLLDKGRQVKFQSRQRELWIRMLAGDPYYPNLWDRWAKSSDPTLAARKIDDYILATNLVSRPLVIDPANRANDEPRGFNAVAYERQDLFDDAPLDKNHYESMFWLELMFMQKQEPVLPYDAVNNLYIERDESPIPFAYTTSSSRDAAGTSSGPTAILGNGATTGTQVGYTIDEMTGAHFWNSLDNIASPEVGTPELPRIPETVRAQFRFLFQSPYPGAPDHDRMFARSIDLQTAQQRRQQ